LQVPKNEKKTSSKKGKKSATSREDKENNGAINKQSSSSYSSDNESNESQENNVSGVTSCRSKGSVALNLNGKNRAGRGSATDPQSLYARVPSLNLFMIYMSHKGQKRGHNKGYSCLIAEKKREDQ
jgi:hypothetical protein